MYPARDAAVPQTGPLIDNPAREFAQPPVDPYQPVSGYTDPAGQFLPYGDRNAAAAGMRGETSFRPAPPPPEDGERGMIDLLMNGWNATQGVRDAGATAVGLNRPSSPTQPVVAPAPGGERPVHEVLGQGLGEMWSGSEGLRNALGAATGVYRGPVSAPQISIPDGQKDTSAGPNAARIIDTRMRDQFRDLADPYADPNAVAAQEPTGKNQTPADTAVDPYGGEPYPPRSASAGSVTMTVVGPDGKAAQMNIAGHPNMLARHQEAGGGMRTMTEADVAALREAGIKISDAAARDFLIGKMVAYGPDWAAALGDGGAEGEALLDVQGVDVADPYVADTSGGSSGGGGRPWVNYGRSGGGGYSNRGGGGYSRGGGGGYSNGGGYSGGGDLPAGFGSGGGMFPEGFPFDGDEFDNPIFARMGTQGGRLNSAMRVKGKRSRSGRMRSGKRGKVNASGPVNPNAPEGVPTNESIRDEVDTSVKKRTKKKAS
jgi:hypothetical protein